MSMSFSLLTTIRTRRYHLMYGVLILTCLFWGTHAFAAAEKSCKPGECEYQSLVAIPGFDDAAASTSLVDYFNKIYLVLIGIGALIAFVKITMAGVKWSFSEIITDKSQAKEDIRMSLLGLLILLAPYIVLYQINPNLVNLNIFQNAKKVEMTTISGSSAGLTAAQVKDQIAAKDQKLCTDSNHVYDPTTMTCSGAVVVPMSCTYSVSGTELTTAKANEKANACKATCSSKYPITDSNPEKKKGGLGFDTISGTITCSREDKSFMVPAR